MMFLLNSNAKCQCGHKGKQHYPSANDGDNRSTSWPCKKCGNVKCESFMTAIKKVKKKKPKNKSNDKVKAFIKFSNKEIFVRVGHSYFPLSDFHIIKEKLIQSDEGIWMVDDKNGTEKIVLE